MLDRRAVVARILKDRGDALVVTGLGSTTWDTAAAGDNPHNLYLWGGMGGAASCALGLALAQPDRRVLVLTGDGEMLMGLGSLATAAVQKPTNLAVCVIDNLANGLAAEQLTVEDYHAGAEANRDRLVADLRAVVPRLSTPEAPAPQ